MKKAYPTYKETEIPWLPEMPSGWKVKPLGRVGKFSKGKGISRADLVEEGIPAILYGDIYTKYNLIAKDIINKIPASVADNSYQLLKGDILFAASGETIEDIGKTVVTWNDETTYCGGDVIILSKASENPIYLGYLLNCSFVQFEKSRRAKGEIIVHLYASKIKDIKLPIPSLPEQRQIAAYLDHKCALIDTFVAKKKRLIELLQEQKQAIINQSVTRGIDPDVPLKPSGVDWLGDIPAHWEVKKLKYAAVVQNGIAINERTQANGDIELPYLRVANVQDGYVDLSKMKTLKLDSSVMHRYLVEEGDLLMNEGGDFDKLGRGVVWGGQIEPCVHQNHVFVLKVDSKEDPHWINLLSRSEYGKLYFILSSKQTTNLASISSSKLKDFPLVVPPKKERERIKKFLRESESEIDVIINRLDGELTLIQEYKTTLIAEAVTGKIDVRDWHAEADIPEQLKTALS